MNILDFIGVLNNVLGLLLIFVSIIGGLYLFFIDPIRRWSFFGYFPTVVLALIDYDTKEILTIEYEHKLALDKQMPQGSIYNSDILDAVENTIQRELGLDLKYIDLEYIKELGTLKSDDVKRLRKFQYGMLSLVPLVKGKGYILCICTVRKEKVMRNHDLGVSIEKADFMTLNKFKEYVYSDRLKTVNKARIYEKAIKVIDQWLK